MVIRAEIFVEGKSDKKFLDDYLAFLNLSDLIKISPLKGKGEVKNIAETRIEENNRKGIKSITIVDTDLSKESTWEELNKYPVIQKMDAVFLIPNDKDPGALETILENIAKPGSFTDFESCWDSYVSCIESQPTGFRGPFAKSKIYAYMEAVSPLENKKFTGVDKVDFQDINHWDLNADYLNPLKEFIQNI